MNKHKEIQKEIKKTSVKIPSLETFLKAGAHFGHKKSAWNPKMDEFIYDERDGIHIIDLIKTMQCLKDALAKIENEVDFGNVLIVGTKGQAASVVTRVANESGAFYVNNRWPGGLFTNFKIIKKGLERLAKLEETLAAGGGDSTKKEQLMMQREVDRLNRIYSGIKLMERLPKLVIVVDSKVESIAIKESNIVGVPVVALLDTNCDPTCVEYPIPANDDSIKSITLFVELLGEAIKKGRKSQILMAMRDNYYGQLESSKKSYESNLKKEEAMREEEMNRMKRLRLGQENLEKEQKVEEKVEEEKKAEKKAPKKVEKKTKKKVAKKTEKKAEKKKAEKKKVAKKVTKKVEKKKTEKKEKDGKKTIAELDLGYRAEKSLLNAGIKTLAQLKKKKEEELLELEGLGPKTVDQIMKEIK